MDPKTLERRRPAVRRDRRRSRTDHAEPARRAQQPDADDVARARRRSATSCPTRCAWSSCKGAGDCFSAGIDRSCSTRAASRARSSVVDADAGSRDEEILDGDRRLPARLHLAARPAVRLGRRGARLRDRRRLPAGARVRPAGRRRRRAVLHEGAGARPGARPRGNKTARRACWLLAGAGDLCHREVRRGGRGPRHRARHSPSYPPRSWTRPSPTWWRP